MRNTTGDDDWLWLYLTFQRGARLLIPAVSADLMAPPFVSAPTGTMAGDIAAIDMRPEPGHGAPDGAR